MTRHPEILMTPGPTPVPHFVLEAQAAPLVYHRGPAYGAMLREVAEGVQWLLGTRSDVVVHTSSGSGAMESAVANLTSPGERVLVVSVGYFGQRFADIARIFGCDVELIDYEWGKVVKAKDVAAALDKDPDLQKVFIQHSETSTGVVNDIESVALETSKRERLLIVDAISSAGAIPIEMDKWGIGVTLGGSQKALGASPGVSFVAVSDKAWEAHKASTNPRAYWDWSAYKKSYSAKDPESPYTPAVSVIAGLAAAVREARAEGLEAIFNRHRLLARAVKNGIAAIGLDLVGEDRERAVVVSAVRTPEGLNADRVVAALRDRHGIVVGPGQGPFKGQGFRVGHLGWLTEGDILRFFAALEMVLAEEGFTIKFGAGVAAAQEVFSAK